MNPQFLYAIPQRFEVPKVSTSHLDQLRPDDGARFDVFKRIEPFGKRRFSIAVGINPQFHISIL